MLLHPTQTYTVLKRSWICLLLCHNKTFDLVRSWDTHYSCHNIPITEAAEYDSTGIANPTLTSKHLPTSHTLQGLHDKVLDGIDMMLLDSGELFFYCSPAVSVDRITGG